MAILTKGTTINLSATIQIVDMFAYEGIIYYLARSISRDGLQALDLTDAPPLLVCSDPLVTTIPPNVVTYAKEFVRKKYGR